MNEFTHLDLFSGIGGFSLGFEAEGFRTVAFAERDPDAALILDAQWPGVPNLGDVTAICGNDFGRIDALTAGVPCQPASLLGKRRGAADERWLWPDTLRLVGLFRPRFCLFENPPALLTLDGGRACNGIIAGLAALGYVGFHEVLPAAAVGAGHLRERLFILAANPDDIDRWSGGRGSDGEKTDYPSSSAADLHDQGLEGYSRHGARERRSTAAGSAPAPLVRGLEREDWLATESPVDPLVHGLPGGLAESTLRCVGNAVVPQVARIFARAIRQSLTEGLALSSS